MINYGKEIRINNLKYSFLGFYKSNKAKLLILAFLLLLSLLTGIFTAIKLYNINSEVNLLNYSFVTLIDGAIYTFSIFIKRFLSMLLVIGLLILFSLNKYISVFGYLLLCYRAFLLSINCTLIVIVLGIGGAINGILIILPCHLIEILLMSLIFILGMSACKNKKAYGSFGNGFSKHLTLIIVASLIVDILEILLLYLFKASTILII